MNCGKMNCFVVGVALVLAALLATGVQAGVIGHFETISPSPNPMVYVQGGLDDGGAGPPDFYAFTDLADETLLYGDVTGLLELAPDGANGPGDFSNFTAGNIAVVDRGAVPFTDKILAAEGAGAIGVIIANTSTATNAGLGGVQVNIPTLLLFQNASEDLKNEMLNDAITARLAIGPNVPIPLAPGPFDVRQIRVTGATIDNQAEALQVLDFADGGPNAKGWTIAVDQSDTRNLIDIAGGGGTFSSNHPYPDGVNDDTQDDVVVQVKPLLNIPEGDWTIGFGSDDGGQLTLAGVTFTNEFNTDGDPGLDDTVLFNAPRGHSWTNGEFTVPAGGISAALDASFFERTGGDSFEIAIAPGFQGNAAAAAGAWTLLEDGALGWSVAVIPEPSTLVLAGVALMGLLVVGPRRRKAA